MNTNKVLSIIIFSIAILSFGHLEVNAENTCNMYSSSQEACEAHTYKGYKCEWDRTKKGGSRCYKSNKLSEEKKQATTKCSEITDSNTCGASTVDGHGCIWRQNACYDNTLIDDGTNDTKIVDDKKEKTTTTKRNQNNSDIKSTDKTINCTELTSSKECSAYGKCRWMSGTCQEQTVAQEPCNDKNIRRVLKIFGYILMIAKITVPLLIIAFGTFDLYKATMDKDEKAILKQSKVLIVRILAGIFIFFIPTIVDVIFSISGKWNMSEDTQYQTCASCVLNPTDNEKCSVD